MKQVILNTKKPTIYLSDVSEDKTYLVKDNIGDIGIIANSSAMGEGWSIQYPNTYIPKNNTTLTGFIKYLLNEGYEIFEIEGNDFKTN